MNKTKHWEKSKRKSSESAFIRSSCFFSIQMCHKNSTTLHPLTHAVFGELSLFDSRIRSIWCCCLLHYSFLDFYTFFAIISTSTDIYIYITFVCRRCEEWYLSENRFGDVYMNTLKIVLWCIWANCKRQLLYCYVYIHLVVATFCFCPA